MDMTSDDCDANQVLFCFVLFCFYFLLLNLFIYSGLFRATPMAYGSSQARSRLGAMAAGLQNPGPWNNGGSVLSCYRCSGRCPEDSCFVHVPGPRIL